ncbi:MAG TPA: response regulator FixJ [Alphaproteobacteria bacterium]
MTSHRLIYVVDDDDAVRDSLQALLESKGYQVASCASAAAFLKSYKPGPVCCAIVDVQMPGMDGMALLAKVKDTGLAIPIIVVTGHGDIPLAVRAMKAGAVDFIEKPYSNDAILDVLGRAFASVQYGGGEAAPAEVAARIAGLTARERDVLAQLVVGNPNKIIAHELKISPRTVEIHRANLMKKMQADSLSHLIRMALAAGIGGKSR